MLFVCNNPLQDNGAKPAPETTTAPTAAPTAAPRARRASQP